jgi:Fur family transcriptional regulator, ferric uptake regulator
MHYNIRNLEQAMRTSSVELVILEILNQEQAHLTSHEVYEHIRGRFPAVNPSTVYRALERLVNNGKISISDMGLGSEVYESVENGIHHHLVCQKCGQVITLGPGEVGKFFSVIQEEYHFLINTNHLILFGICETCQAAGKVQV